MKFRGFDFNRLPAGEGTAWRKEFPETLGGTYLFKVKDKKYFGSALAFIHRLIEHRYEIKKNQFLRFSIKLLKMILKILVFL